MGARRLDPWLRREINEAVDQIADEGYAEVAAVYYSPKAREQIRQAILREGRRRGLLIHTEARGSNGQLRATLASEPAGQRAKNRSLTS